ncbi:hypothetical protein FA13DRAFT_1259573 [Coprinellus micaceus]|uniref:Uncharacterized protein n=1 Tax=Coprinellus micaceus TaxID=71717 RepID=A0A4Y7ST41_COPMI|nr:hypothetical protein FA13DRAFT_1259573 [Coprinellus micaceus]
MPQAPGMKERQRRHKYLSDYAGHVPMTCYGPVGSIVQLNVNLPFFPDKNSPRVSTGSQLRLKGAVRHRPMGSNCRRAVLMSCIRVLCLGTAQSPSFHHAQADFELLQANDSRQS